MKKSKKKSYQSEIDKYNQAYMDELREILESSGMRVTQRKEPSDENTNRYEVTFWRKKKK